MAVTIDRCTGADIEDVVRFLDEHWARGHALVASRPLLDWQHRNADGGYSFVVARSDGDVAGILGYIPTRRFDPALANANVVWLTTWKVRHDATVAGLGLALLQHLAAMEPHIAIGAIGLNPATRPIYEALGYRLGELQHYVFPNVTLRRFELASLTLRPAPPGDDPATPLTAMALSRQDEFERLADAGFPAPTGVVPRKTARYFHARYVCHPLYSYRVLALTDREAVVGLLAARTTGHAGRRALRIVDFLGPPDLIGRLGRVLQSLVQEQDAEYADVYNVGIGTAAFERAGFRRVDPDGGDVVPNHFEPFERRNVRLWFSIKGAGDPMLFKGDADQDRPSALPNVSQ
jgi:hypothetical protein